jgi:hypothetical protein
VLGQHLGWSQRQIRHRDARYPSLAA